MRLLRVCLPALLLSGAAAFAEDFTDFTQGMKYTDQAASALRKMEKKTGPQAVRAAEGLGGVYEEMIGFFRQRGAQDAVKLAEDGKAAATKLASAAFANDAEGADAAFKAVSATCRPCHDAYRSRAADGKYHFKTATERSAAPAPAKPAAPQKK